MYTTDDRKDDLYEDEYYEESNWDYHKGLIFKIIIIILCIIVLIWLIKALKGNRNLSDNGEVHVANTEKIRLASENYYFIRNNKDRTSNITLAELKSAGLIGDVVDANNKVCSTSGTNVNLNKQDGVYKMVINFACSTNDQDEVFFYNYNTLACLNCNGKTNMTGKDIVKADEKEEKEEDKNDDNNTPDDSDQYKYYSCIDWTDWSKDRIYDSTLTERTKTLVQGVKYNTKTVYGDWSEYSTTPVVGGDGVEVDTKTETVTSWSKTKTGTDIDPNSSKIKIISEEVVNENNNSCKDGYVENDTCYSNKVEVGNLSFKEFTSGKYKVLNGHCDRMVTIKDNDGIYTLTYINCQYNKAIDTGYKTGNSYTVYKYKVLKTSEVTYYRYRTVTTINEPAQYTTIKYEESKLPEGYVKVDGTEEVYYSYRATDCVK